MATGNEVTCAVQASVSQFGLSVPLYALSLNTYFLLAVKHNFDITKVRWVEKWCHIIPIGISLLLSILLLAYKEYGVDESRCWLAPQDLRCLNEDYSDQEESQCQREQYWSTILFESVMPFISFAVSFILFITTLVMEVLKRRNNSELTGKRLYFETARQRKSRFILTQMGVNVLALFLCFSIFHSRNLVDKQSFPFVLTEVVLDTLFGFFIVLIFLKIKLPADSFETSKFSLRRSVRSKETFHFVTGGYVPKPRRPTIKDDGGIYMGDDDDCGSFDEFEDEEYDVSDYNMTFVTTRSVDDGCLQLTAMTPDK